MIYVKEAIVVEGRYDKAALSGVVDTLILDTEGFGIFSDKAKLSLLRRIADIQGLIVMTDSDGGGFLIRSFLKSSIDPKRVKHAYIPDIYGKERRKRAASKEGKLGVEGMSADTLLKALRRAGATIEGEAEADERKNRIRKSDFYDLGLTGKPDSASRRAYVKKRFELPERLTTNALLDVLNIMTDLNDLTQIMEKYE